MAVPARRRVVLLAPAASDLAALEASLAGRDDLRVVARVTTLAAAATADADLVIARPAALATAAIPAPEAAGGGPGGSGAGEDLPQEALTPRELDVLGLLADGRGNRDIAAALGISEHTVKFHLASIFGKLGVATRTAAVQRALRLGAIRL